MNKIVFLCLVLLSISSVAQQTDYNLKKGYAAEGYDVTEYFNNKAVEGNAAYVASYDGVKFKFVNQKNLDKFKIAPQKYAPQYGGYCAYAIADQGKKVSINPETFEIRDGKLYLFYNSWGTNTLEKWNEEGPEKLRKQADIEWKSVRTKN